MNSIVFYTLFYGKIIAGTLGRVVIAHAICLVVAYFLNKNGNFFGMSNLICFPALISLFGTPVAVSSAPQCQLK